MVRVFLTQVGSRTWAAWSGMWTVHFPVYFQLGFFLLEACARPHHEGLVGAGSRVGSPLGHSDGSVSSSALSGAPIHWKESHTFPLEIRIEPNCAPGQSPASSAGPSRPGKGPQMVLA